MSEIVSKILELCSEDDYGVWELWWALEGNQSTENADLKSAFVKAISDLIAQGKIVAKRPDTRTPITGQAKHVEFAEDLLRAELNDVDNPRPNEMYWFGTPDC